MIFLFMIQISIYGPMIWEILYLFGTENQIESESQNFQQMLLSLPCQMVVQSMVPLLMIWYSIPILLEAKTGYFK